MRFVEQGAVVHLAVTGKQSPARRLSGTPGSRTCNIVMVFDALQSNLCTGTSSLLVHLMGHTRSSYKCQGNMQQAVITSDVVGTQAQYVGMQASLAKHTALMEKKHASTFTLSPMASTLDAVFENLQD